MENGVGITLKKKEERGTFVLAAIYNSGLHLISEKVVEMSMCKHVFLSA